MAAETVRATRDGNVLELALDRPQAGNALDAATCELLLRRLREARRERSVRCVVIRGAGDTFCAGLELAAGADPGALLREAFNPLIRELRAMGAPVVAAIRGTAAGAGLGLALACDLRVMAADATLRPGQASLGLPPDPATLYYLPRMCGLSRALSLLLEDGELDSTVALALGVAGHVFAPEAFDAETLALTQRLAAAPTLALDLMKRGFDHGVDAALDTALEHEALLQHVAGQSLDYREGVAAFLEKRQPVFRGE